MQFNLQTFTTEKLKELLEAKLAIEVKKRTEVQVLAIEAIQDELKNRGVV
jgi:hypothetical protein